MNQQTQPILVKVTDPTNSEYGKEFYVTEADKHLSDYYRLINGVLHLRKSDCTIIQEPDVPPGHDALMDAYYAGFNQSHYSTLHPDVVPPKEMTAACDEWLISKLPPSKEQEPEKHVKVRVPDDQSQTIRDLMAEIDSPKNNRLERYVLAAMAGESMPDNQTNDAPFCKELVAYALAMMTAVDNHQNQKL